MPYLKYTSESYLFSEKYGYKHDVDNVITTTNFSYRIKKSRCEFSCRICDKLRPKGTRYIGDKRFKVCYLHFDEYHKNNIKLFKDILKDIKTAEDETKLNIEKWKQEEVINAL
jgi:hypothetical protein